MEIRVESIVLITKLVSYYPTIKSPTSNEAYTPDIVVTVKVTISNNPQASVLLSASIEIWIIFNESSQIIIASCASASVSPATTSSATATSA